MEDLLYCSCWERQSDRIRPPTIIIIIHYPHCSLGVTIISLYVIGNWIRFGVEAWQNVLTGWTNAI